MEKHKEHAVKATNMVIKKPDTYKTLVSAKKCPICNPKKKKDEKVKNDN